MKRGALGVACGALGTLAALGGCTVGSGSGSAMGSLWVIGCNNGQNLEADGGPVAYNLHPSFFAATPIEDLTMGTGQTNEISLRMQSSGLAFLYTDTLYFDVENSFEVARCLRGRTVNGQPDWNATEPLPLDSVTPALAGSDPAATDWCDWSATASADGGGVDASADAGAAGDGGMSVMAAYPRIHLTPYTDLRSGIGLLETCPQANVTGEAVDGWVEFQNFGGAEQPDLAPENRTAVPTNFVINYGDRLKGTFHVILQDTQVVNAANTNVAPPTPLIGGTLDGYFDFDLERGRAAQAFPEGPMAEVIVEIDGLAFGGDAVGRQRDPVGGESASDGRATFVPLAAPGERVRARIERAKGRVAWAELVAIERPGPDRVAPPCPLFGSCGGCQWQHVSLAGQRAAKKAIVERALGTTIAPVRAGGPAFGYRDRAKLAVGAGGALGFRARRSHEVVDLGATPACPLFGPALGRALPALHELGRGLAPGVEIDLQAGAEGVHLNVVRADADGAAHARREIDRLGAAGVVGLALGGKPTLGREDVDVAEPDSPPLAIPAGGFAQVGRAANAALVAAVLEAVGPAPGVVLELHAGSGTFTRHLVAPAPAGLYACDGDPAAVARGRRNAPAALWSARPPAIVPDTVLLDPPREGADREHMTVALRARQRIVYVSCDPQTLGRDARRLLAAGFRLARAVALDLMPQTFHVEVVATFERIDPVPPSANLDRAGLLP